MVGGCLPPDWPMPDAPRSPQLAAPTDRALQARQLLRAHRHGVLSTLSRRFDGMPFGSIAPFVLDHQARPLLLVSTLAEHTRKRDGDPRCSLLAHDGADNPQAAARVTVLGRARRLPDATGVRERYLRYVPEAQELLALGDFHFHVLEVEALRYIGGFGSIHWIDAADFLLAPGPAEAAEPMLLEQWNNARNLPLLRAWCLRRHGLQPRQPTLVGVDVDGFDLRTEQGVLRQDFARPAVGAQALQLALRQALEA